MIISRIIGQDGPRRSHITPDALARCFGTFKKIKCRPNTVLAIPHYFVCHLFVVFIEIRKNFRNKRKLAEIFKIFYSIFTSRKTCLWDS